MKGLARHPDVAILSDEIYDVMTYDGEAHCSLLDFPEIRDRLIILNGWSKTWAMTGWRMGWSIWPNSAESGRLYDKVRKLAVNCWSCVNAPSQYAGIAAIDGPQDDVDKMMRAFDRRRKLVVDGLNRLPGVSCITPKGAFYAFPNVAGTGWKAKKLASALLEEAGVALIGGPDFGILGEGYIRLSYANSEENIARALERVGSFWRRRRSRREVTMSICKDLSKRRRRPCCSVWLRRRQCLADEPAKICGGLQGLACDARQFCDFPGGTCGAARPVRRLHAEAGHLHARIPSGVRLRRQDLRQ